jgi:hypothetical protein
MEVLVLPVPAQSRPAEGNALKPRKEMNEVGVVAALQAQAQAKIPGEITVSTIQGHLDSAREVGQPECLDITEDGKDAVCVKDWIILFLIR